MLKVVSFLYVIYVVLGVKNNGSNNSNKYNNNIIIIKKKKKSYVMNFNIHWITLNLNTVTSHKDVREQGHNTQLYASFWASTRFKRPPCVCTRVHVSTSSLN